MYCPYCGNNIREGASRCPVCGNGIRPPEPAHPAAAQNARAGSTMPGGITCASILLYIQGGISVSIFLGLLFLLFFVLRMTPQEFWSNPDAPKVIALCVAVTCILLVVTVMPFLAALRLRRGERILAALMGCFSLINFPLGTAFGILILMGVFDSESVEWCARQRNAYITP